MCLGVLVRLHSWIQEADNETLASSSRPSLVLVDCLQCYKTCESTVLKVVITKLVSLWEDLLSCLNFWQDDPSAMDFVTSAANLRMHIFSMNMKSRFDIKCKLFYTLVVLPKILSYSFLTVKHIRLCFSAMAGNIIPAIATTNAVIAGLIVLEGLKILSGKIDQCRTVSISICIFMQPSFFFSK